MQSIPRESLKASCSLETVSELGLTFEIENHGYISAFALNNLPLSVLVAVDDKPRVLCRLPASC